MLASLFSIVQSVWAFLLTGVKTLGYPGIVGLMALESSFFPFPSEVVMPPAGALAKDGHMSLVIVIVCGIAGSIMGALFNYWIAVRFGRPFCLKYGKYFFLSESKFRKSEAFFRRHGEIGTFVGRLLPGVRQIISFPAGLARMPLGRFCFFTALGSGIWVVVLALIGYFIGADLNMVKDHAHKILFWMAPGLLLLVAGYVVWHVKFRRPPEEAPAGDAPADKEPPEDGDREDA